MAGKAVNVKLVERRNYMRSLMFTLIITLMTFTTQGQSMATGTVESSNSTQAFAEMARADDIRQVEVRPTETITTVISSRSWNSIDGDLRNLIDSPVRSDIQELTVGGFFAVSFIGEIEGQQQAVIALDLGYRTLIVSSNDTTRTIQEMQDLAKSWIDQAMKEETLTDASNACNCVLYARSQTTSLPTGMTTYSEKLSKRNTLFPTVASNPNSGVAIIQVVNSSTGHVAVNRVVTVQSDGSLSLRVQEANWTPCSITYRTGTLEALKVQGFFDPRYPSGDAYPRITSATPTSGYAGQQFWISVSGSGFQSSSMRAVILGGSYCTTFDRCQVPTSVITNRTSTTARVPVTLGSGNFRLYIFNSAQGKTSNGIPIRIS